MSGIGSQGRRIHILLTTISDRSSYRPSPLNTSLSDRLGWQSNATNIALISVTRKWNYIPSSVRIILKLFKAVFGRQLLASSGGKTSEWIAFARSSVCEIARKLCRLVNSLKYDRHAMGAPGASPHYRLVSFSFSKYVDHHTVAKTPHRTQKRRKLSSLILRVNFCRGVILRARPRIEREAPSIKRILFHRSEPKFMRAVPLGESP